MTTLTLETPEAPAKLWTIDEFIAMPDSKNYELVEGVLIERREMGVLSTYVATQLTAELVIFCRATGAGHAFNSDAVYRCFDDPNSGRKPDVSFIAAGRMPGGRFAQAYITIPADVAVEVVSPNDSAYEVDDKVALYLKYEFGEVWVIYPNSRTMQVHRRGQAILTYRSGEKIQGRGALAGFECELEGLFPSVDANIVH